MAQNQQALVSEVGEKSAFPHKRGPQSPESEQSVFRVQGGVKIIVVKLGNDRMACLSDGKIQTGPQGCAFGKLKDPNMAVAPGDFFV